ncbi:hypothetical protein [Methylovorus mays]|uniref:hypothetical protein n=1 Tax=Methylovorus mays TaxID=184077 RepID=UPI001E45B735|nr:hypothetical protein [Methylovorus mays]MCB5207803.1 hypothetical protein [Methylovorus mays]
MNSTISNSASAMIKTGFWECQELVESMTTEDKFLLLYFLTCKDRHVSGVFKLNKRMATARLGWDINQISLVEARLAGFEEIIIEESWVWVTSWFDHNAAPSPTHDKKIRERLLEVPFSLRERWLSDANSRGLDVSRWISISRDHSQVNSLSIGSAYPIDSVPSPHGGVTHTLSVNNNSNNILNNNTNITLNMGPLVRIYEQYFLNVIAEFALNGEAAQDIADELQKYLVQGKINNVEGWIRRMAELASQGRFSKSEKPPQPNRYPEFSTASQVVSHRSEMPPHIKSELQHFIRRGHRET